MWKIVCKIGFWSPHAVVSDLDSSIELPPELLPELLEEVLTKSTLLMELDMMRDNRLSLVFEKTGRFYVIGCMTTLSTTLKNNIKRH